MLRCTPWVRQQKGRQFAVLLNVRVGVAGQARAGRTQEVMLGAGGAKPSVSRSAARARREARWWHGHHGAWDGAVVAAPSGAARTGLLERRWSRAR